MGVTNYYYKNITPSQTHGLTEIYPSTAPQMVLIIGHGFGERNAGDLAGCIKSSGWGGWANIKAAADAYGVIQIYINTIHDYEFGEYQFALQWARDKYGSVLHNDIWVLGHSLGSYGAGKYAFKDVDFCSKIAGWVVSASGNFLSFATTGGSNLWENLVDHNLRVWGVTAENDTVSGTSPVVITTIYDEMKALDANAEVIKTVFPNTEWSAAASHNQVLARITQRPMYYSGGNFALITDGILPGDIVLNLYEWMIMNPRGGAYIDPTLSAPAYGGPTPAENPITKITGPFCEDLAASYIAHETDTAEAEVPILLEDGTNVFLPENAVGSIEGVECVEGEEKCCNEPSIFTFENSVRTEITWTQSMKDKHGLYPDVQVMYFDQDISAFRVDLLTRNAFVGKPPTKLLIDHGGPSTGIIKII